NRSLPFVRHVAVHPYATAIHSLCATAVRLSFVIHPVLPLQLFFWGLSSVVRCRCRCSSVVCRPSCAAVYHSSIMPLPLPLKL
ncbi:unnamed protein product, partial [Citrullus colocynthis]